MIVNLSVDVDSIELMKLAQEMGVQYIDTVVEPWPGFYFGSTLPNAERTNYPLRERVRALGKAYVGGPTAVSCCGANPGMVSWLLKEALAAAGGRYRGGGRSAVAGGLGGADAAAGRQGDPCCRA
jgi:homospermidine synthase